MPRREQFKRILQGTVYGKELKAFDKICVEQEYTEAEAVREAVKLLNEKHYPDYRKEQPKK